jgi:CRP-like cAMP-binding protein
MPRPLPGRIIETQHQTPTPGVITVTRTGVDASRIAAFAALHDLPGRELEELAAVLREVEMKAGDVVVRRDEYGTAVYFVEEGTAEVQGVEGDASVSLGRGDVIGEIGMLLTGRRIATVVAATPMRLLALSGQDFESIRPLIPGVAQTLRRLGFERADA